MQIYGLLHDFSLAAWASANFLPPTAFSLVQSVKGPFC